MNKNDFDRFNRRHFLANNAMGIGTVALACLLKQENLLATPDKPDLEPQKFDLLPKPTHSQPRATAMISLWMQGGPSHLDLLDPKPMLQKFDGKTFPGKIKYDNAAQASSKLLGSPWKFQKQGQCGTEVSSLLPNLASIVDDITVIRSMRTGVNNHGQSIRALNTGRILTGRPSLCSWLTYGLGCESQELPAYMALTDPGQLPVLGVENWSNGYLPALYQGTVVRPIVPRILNLDAPQQLRGRAQQRYLSYLDSLNRRHLNRHPGELDLEARIFSYELAAKMQTSAKEVLDLSGESAETKKLYGMDEPATAEFGSRCLIARRLVERGVRCVQVFTQNQFWDNHNSIRTNLPRACKKIDKPAAELVTDLKRRGLLDSTLVVWGGEFGRSPGAQNGKGRDHHNIGFSMWMAGGGIRGGQAVGSTDEIGLRAIEKPYHFRDIHATILHLLGLDQDELSYPHQGRDERLQLVEGELIQDVL